MRVFQYKFFIDTLTKSRKQQIKESLSQLIKTHPNTSMWILVIPMNLTRDELNWFGGLRKEYSNISLGIWDYSKLKSLLTQYFRVCYDYFPISESIRNEIDRHFKDLKEKGECTSPNWAACQDIVYPSILIYYTCAFPS